MKNYEWKNGNPVPISREQATEATDNQTRAEAPKQNAKNMLSIQNVEQALLADEIERNEFFTELLEYEQTLQSNLNPLKKGGTRVGYRPDVIIFANRSQLTDEENILFDMASALVSSKPDNEYYVLSPSDYINEIPIPKNHFYEKIRKAAISDTEKGTGINTKPLVFKTVIENPEEPGEYEERVTEIHMFEVLTYQSIRQKGGKKASSKDQVKNSVVFFKPTKAMKALMISSTLTHGAHYNIMIPMGLSGYTKKMYYLLESRKNYRKYENAAKGIFEVTIDEFKELMGIPESYGISMIEKNIIKKAQTELAEVEKAPFIFTYEPIVERQKSGQEKKTGFRFTITDPEEGPTVEEVLEETVDLSGDYVAERALIAGYGYEGKEIEDVLREYVRAGRDIVFLSQALNQVKTQDSTTHNKVGLACSFMKNGFSTQATAPKTDEPKKDRIIIEQADPNIDYDALAEEVLRGRK